MDWTDTGIVLGVRRHGETSVVLDLLTREHGRHPGFVHGGRSRRLRPVLQAGNTVDVEWRARVEEQLGTFTVEARHQRAARLMASAAALHGVQHLTALARLLAEREPHGALFDRLDALMDGLDEPGGVAADLVRFELALLSDLGFGLDLSCCVATGARDDLRFVSPRSGRAVSAAAGAPYADRLLGLPAFLRDPACHPGPDDLAAGFRLTGTFLLRDVLQPRGLGLPDSRAAYLRLVAPGCA